MKLLKQVLVFSISLQLTVGTAFAQATNQPGQGSGSDDETAGVAKELAQGATEPEVRENMARMTEILQSMENHRPIQFTPAERNTFRRMDQTVEIMKPVAQAFDTAGKPLPMVDEASGEPLVEIARTVELKSESPKANIAYTNLRYRNDNGDLLIEATRGENEYGRGGIVVARQRIPNLDLVALKDDDDFLVMVNKRGEVSAITKVEIVKQVFTSLNVFERLAARKTPMDLSNSKVSISMITPGTRPYNDKEVDGDSILREEIVAGDIKVTVQKPSGENYVLGIFSRDTFLDQISAAYKFLIEEKTMVRPDFETVDTARAVFEGEMQNLERIEQDIAAGKRSAIEVEALKTITGSHLGTYLDAISTMKDQKDRPYQKMTPEVWRDLFAGIESRAQQEVKPDDKVSLDVRMERGWKRYIPQHRYGGQSESEVADDAARKKQAEEGSGAQAISQSRAFIRSAVSQLGEVYESNKLVINIVAGSYAYMAIPGIHDALEVQYNLQAINALYSHLFPAVLLDAGHRTNILKGMSLLMTFPFLAMLTSYGVGKALTAVNRIAGENSAKWAVIARDFNKRWGEAALTNYQRVTTFGLRIWAQVIYPVWCRVPELMRQKSFVFSVAAQNNPFSSVRPDSKLGQALGLNSPLYLGLNNPFLGKDDLERRAHLQERANLALVEQKQRGKVMAMNIAALLVAGKTGVDPATLVYVAKNGAKAADIQEILSNGRTARMWYAVSQAMSGSLTDMIRRGIDLDEISFEELADATIKAYDAATALKQQSQGAINAKYLYAKFTRFMSQAGSAAFTYGTGEYDFLYNVVPNLQITNNTKHQLITDYSEGTVMIPLVGPRSNPLEPEKMAHNSVGPLYTSSAHLSEEAYMVFLYQFIVPARMAQVYQSVKVKPDLTYTPAYEIEYNPDEKVEGVVGGLADGLYDVANFKRFGVGNVMMADWVKRLKTISGYLIVGLSMRHFAGNQVWAEAFAGWFLTETTFFFRFTWPWMIQGRAEMAGGERVRDNTKLLNLAQGRIYNGLREKDEGKSRQMLEQGYQDLVGLYRSQTPQVWNGLKNLVGLATKAPVGNPTPASLRSQEKFLEANGFANLVNEHRAFAAQGEHYYGLIVGLAQSLRAGNEARVRQYQEALVSVLEKTDRDSGGGELSASIRKMNAATLLQFAAEPGNSPIFTKQNEKVRNWAINICALYTTYAAIGLSVDSFDTMTLTFANVSTAAATFTSAYVLLSLATMKAPWNFIYETLTIAKNEGTGAAIESIKKKAERAWYGENPEKSKSLEAKALAPRQPNDLIAESAPGSQRDLFVQFARGAQRPRKTCEGLHILSFAK